MVNTKSKIGGLVVLVLLLAGAIWLPE